MLNQNKDDRYTFDLFDVIKLNPKINKFPKNKKIEI